MYICYNYVISSGLFVYLLLELGNMHFIRLKKKHEIADV